MSMSATTFIAVQCFQCSTLQVKQQKKRSNKWTCVVCNQNQSLRKVFAQGFQAKDVRKFVQSVNMSRQLTEQTLIEPSDHIHQPTHNNTVDHTKRRIDWTEYLDQEDLENDQIRDSAVDQTGGFEPQIVTELPKEMFKKPKLKNYSAELNKSEGNKLFSPSFSKRKTYKQPITSQEPRGKDFTQNESLAEKMAPGKLYPTTMAQGTSKWSAYLTEDDEDSLLGADGDFQDPFDPCTSHGVVFDNRFADKRVDDDVHPDFV